LKTGHEQNDSGVVLSDIVSPEAGKSARPKAESGIVAAESLRVDLNTNNLKSKSLTQAEQDWVRQQQSEQAVSAIPMHAIFVLCTMLGIGVMSLGYINEQAVRIWQSLALLPVLAFVALVIRSKRKPELVPTKIIHTLEAIAFAEGLIFLIPIAIFVQDFPIAQKYALYGFTLLLAAIAVFSLVRIPIAAIVVTTLLVGGAFVSMLLGLPANGLVPAAMTLTFGFIMYGIIVNSHWEFVKRANAEVEVNRQKQLVSLLLNDFERGSTDWLWETDTEGRLVYFSPRFATAFGKSEEEIRGKRFSDLVTDSSKLEGWSAFEGAMTRRANVPGIVLPFNKNDITQFWHVTARVLEGNDGQFLGFRGVGRDITDKWRANLVEKEARDTAERASAAKSNFLSVVSHEIRTPINSIVGFSELLASDNEAHAPAERRREYLTNVVSSARQLQTLVGDVLDATRLEKGGVMLKEQEVDAADIVEGAVSRISAEVEKQDISLMVRISDGVTLTGDGERLKQIVGNLLDNAVKFSSQGGIVHVDFQKGRGAEFVLSIRDAGIGMSPAEIARAFDPYTQADQSASRRFGGLGLGLSIARKLAILHSGDLVLRSSPGTGTEARLILPPSRVRWPETRDSGSGEQAA
jgi:PAS domain S-box-containing protein